MTPKRKCTCSCVRHYKSATNNPRERKNRNHSQRPEFSGVTRFTNAAALQTPRGQSSPKNEICVVRLIPNIVFTPFSHGLFNGKARPCDPQGSVQGSALENNYPPPAPNLSIFSPPRAAPRRTGKESPETFLESPTGCSGIEAEVWKRPSRARQERSHRHSLPSPAPPLGPTLPTPEGRPGRPAATTHGTVRSAGLSRRPRQPRPCLTAASDVPRPPRPRRLLTSSCPDRAGPPAPAPSLTHRPGPLRVTPSPPRPRSEHPHTRSCCPGRPAPSALRRARSQSQRAGATAAQRYWR